MLQRLETALKVFDSWMQAIQLASVVQHILEQLTLVEHISVIGPCRLIFAKSSLLQGVVRDIGIPIWYLLGLKIFS